MLSLQTGLLHQYNYMKLNIIIPVRDREEDLNNIIKQLKIIFKKQHIDYHFYIVIQDNDLLFNKGYLNNIGFLYAESKKGTPNYLFNDVSRYPINSKVYNYKYKYKDNTIYHPYGYYHCIGGFFCLKSSVYRQFNGYSNKYNGWGYEDTDLLQRCRILNVNVNRDIFHDRFSEGFKDWTDDQEAKMAIADKTTRIIYENKWYNKPQEHVISDINTDGISQINLEKCNIRYEHSNNITKLFVRDYITI